MPSSEPPDPSHGSDGELHLGARPALSGAQRQPGRGRAPGRGCAHPLRLRRAGSHLAGLPGGRHLRVEPAGAGHHPPRAHLPPRAPQPGGVHGRVGRAGGRAGHAVESGARAGRAALAAGPTAMPAVDRRRRAVLHGQHLERDGHRPGPLLVHHAAPRVHAAHPQMRLQRNDRGHLGAVGRHLPGAPALRLGGDVLGAERGVPGQPRALLRRVLHRGRLLPAALRRALRVLQDLQGRQAPRGLLEAQPRRPGARGGAGEGRGPAAPDGVHGAPPCRHLPHGGPHLAGAEGAAGRPHGGHPHRRVRALLDSLLHHRAGRPALLLGRPRPLEERLPLAGVLQLLLQPPHLHRLQQELQQRLQDFLLQAALSGGRGEALLTSRVSGGPAWPGLLLSVLRVVQTSPHMWEAVLPGGPGASRRPPRAVPAALDLVHEVSSPPSPLQITGIVLERSDLADKREEVKWYGRVEDG